MQPGERGCMVQRGALQNRTVPPKHRALLEYDKKRRFDCGSCSVFTGVTDRASSPVTLLF